MDSVSPDPAVERDGLQAALAGSSFYLLPIGAGATLVIAITAVEAGKVEFVVEQVMHGGFKTARQQLLLQIHRQESRAGVDCFISGHRHLLNSSSGLNLDIPYGSRHDADMNAIFLQRRWAHQCLASS